jgi:hypothetical protein
MPELPFGDLLPATFKGARTLRALMALMAASLLAACGTGNGGYQQGYYAAPQTVCGSGGCLTYGSSYCDVSAPNYVAIGCRPRTAGSYPVPQVPQSRAADYQPPHWDSTPSPSSNWMVPSAAAAETFATA